MHLLWEFRCIRAIIWLVVAGDFTTEIVGNKTFCRMKCRHSVSNSENVLEIGVLTVFLCCCWICTWQSLRRSSLLEFESLLKQQVAWTFNRIRQVAPTAQERWALPRISGWCILLWYSTQKFVNVHICELVCNYLQSPAIAFAIKTVMLWSCYLFISSVHRFFDVPGPIFAKLCHKTRYVLQ